MAPRSAEQFEVIRQASREKILDSALFCFSKYGYHGTSISKIANHAGVSKGLMYNYYDSKPEVLKAIIMRFFERSMAIIQFDPDKPVRERLRALLKSSFELIRKEKESYRLLVSVELQPGVKEELGDFIEVLKARKKNAWEGILAEMDVPNPDLTGKIFEAIIGGASLSYMLLNEGEYDLQEIEDYLIKTYIDEK